MARLSFSMNSLSSDVTGWILPVESMMWCLKRSLTTFKKFFTRSFLSFLLIGLQGEESEILVEGGEGRRSTF